jgi:hypothetical protein
VNPSERTIRRRKRITVLGAITAFFVLAAGAAAWGLSRRAIPFVFDPGDTELAQSGWIEGIGCPTDATTFDGTSSTPYTDPACETGDRRDDSNEGPLMAFNAAGALVDITAVHVRRLSIVFDEGQDTGPDNFGLAVLDNIDVNGKLVGQGRGTDDDDDHGHDH